MDAKEMLNKYSDNLVGLDSLRLEKQAVIDTILTPEIKEKLAEIEAEFAPKVEALSAENERLAAQIREQVLELGATVSGDFHQAIFTKGRVSMLETARRLDKTNLRPVLSAEAMRNAGQGRLW